MCVRFPRLLFQQTDFTKYELHPLESHTKLSKFSFPPINIKNMADTKKCEEVATLALLMLGP